MRRLFIALVVISVAVLLVGVGRERTNLQQWPGTSVATGGKTPMALKPGSPAPRVDTDFGKIPLYFIANKGQLDERVAYYVQGKDKTIYFTPQGLTIALAGPRPGTVPDSPQTPLLEKEGNSLSPESLGNERSRITPSDAPSERWVLKLDFVGANPDVKPVAQEKTDAVISYFKGKPEEWHTGLPTYSRIIYRDLWPGIDLAYCGTANRLKYEFVVHPGADPTRICLAYRGAESISIDESGRLHVLTPVGGFNDDAPVAYQDVAGKRTDVQLAYRVDGVSGHGFEVGEYDRSLPLILDPAIFIYAGYIGGSSDDWGYGIAVDSAGCAYVTGSTRSSEASFPVKEGPDLTLTWRGPDAFVAKVNASGTALEYCGYIGGDRYDVGYRIAVDSAGCAYVGGTTESTQSTFPVTVGPDLTFNDEVNADVFVAKVSASGTALIYCGYIGGNSDLDDAISGIAVDSLGCAYITGHTYASEATFPVTVGPDLTNGGYRDAYVAKIKASGVALDYCGYIGGDSYDEGLGIAVDADGCAYVVGMTSSSEATFPVIVGPDLSFNGDCDGFVAKVNAAGTALDYCGYIGGRETTFLGAEMSVGVAVDSTGCAYVVGHERWCDEIECQGYEYFNPYVVKIHPSGESLVYDFLVREGAGPALIDIAVDSGGSAYVAAGYDEGSRSWWGKIWKINPFGTASVFSADIEIGGIYGIAFDASGNGYAVGYIDDYNISTFPVKVGPDLTYNGGYSDAFVAKAAYDPDFTAASKNLSKSAAMSSRYPKVATDPATDSVFAVWVETSGGFDSLYFSRSTNGGLTWGAPLALSALGGQILGGFSDLEDDYCLAIAADSPYVHVVMQKRSGVGDDFEIFYRRSPDLGATWDSWLQLTNNETPSMHPDVAARAGCVHVCYEDFWLGNNEIMYKRIAANGGGAVDQTRRLTIGPGNSRFPRVAASKNGDTMHVVYQDDFTGQDQVYYKHIDGAGAGVSWTRALTVGGFWNGLPDIAVSTGADDQYVYIAYQSFWPGNMDIMYKRLGNYGHAGGSERTARLSYSDAESNCAAVSFDPQYNRVQITYHDMWTGNNDVMYRQLADYGGGGFTGRRVSWGTGDSSHASLAGSSGLVYVVWSDNTSGNYEVYFKKSN